MNRAGNQRGFTLIEMIVSLGLFSVVVTISVGALLILIAANRQLQEEQSTLTNLAFALDSMSRELRTGSSYYCAEATDINAEVGGTRVFASSGGNRDLDSLGLETSDCPQGRTGSNSVQGVAFIEGGNSLTGTTAERIMYFYYDNDPTDDDLGTIYRKIGNGVAQPIVSDDIHIINAEFFVTGSFPAIGSGSGTTDNQQASVTIIIEAAADNPNIISDTKRHLIQTTITQRSLDI